MVRLFILTVQVKILRQQHSERTVLLISRAHFSLNPDHRQSVEKTRKTMISSLEKRVKYTGSNETKNHGRPYLIYSSYEINLIANSMERRLGLRYNTLLINCHCQANGDNAVCRSTVNLSYRRLLPKITRVQKIQQGTNNEGKWKESSFQQVNQWLIMLDRLPEEKE